MQASGIHKRRLSVTAMMAIRGGFSAWMSVKVQVIFVFIWTGSISSRQGVWSGMGVVIRAPY